MGWKGARGAGWPATWGREAPEDSGGGRGGQVREGVVEDVPFERDLEKHRTSLAASLAGRRPWSTCSIPGRWVWSPSRWWSHRRFKGWGGPVSGNGMGRLSAVSCGTLGSQRSTLPSLGWRRLLRGGAPQVVFRPRSPGATSLWAGDQSRSLPKWPPDDKRISALELKRCSMARGCLQGVKYLMFAFNLLFWLGGCGILGVGVWLATTQGSFATLSSSFPSLSAANLLIVTGTFVMAIGFVGCIGAIKENKCLLLTGDMEFGAWCLQGAIWDPSAWPRLRGDCMGTPGEDRPASLAPSPHPHPGALWGRVGASWTVPCSPAPVLSALLPRAVTWR
ncbi:tetraspanin-4 isoform X4 [Manis javanica]|uniref:tetraspanin-4 isoform X4 n=1 Tax=Manis javanica TaxID=9974 RepID=UPI003C6DA716